MTFEELRREADRQGYKLLPKEKYQPLKPCKCGANRRNRVYRYISEDEEEVGLKCTNCGFVVWGTSARAAQRRWNKEVMK